MRHRKILRRAQTLIAASVYFSLIAFARGESVNKDSKAIAEFEKRVSEYVKLHNRARSGLPPAKSTDSPEMIVKREAELADQIRALRPETKRGVIFNESSRAEFRRLVRISSQGANGTRIRTSLARSEPVDIPIRVNGAYPRDLALQSTPSTLLQNLPPLPKEVEYRVVGKKLVLRDIEANLIVDYMDDVIR